MKSPIEKWLSIPTLCRVKPQGQDAFNDDASCRIHAEMKLHQLKDRTSDYASLEEAPRLFKLTHRGYTMWRSLLPADRRKLRPVSVLDLAQHTKELGPADLSLVTSHERFEPPIDWQRLTEDGEKVWKRLTVTQALTLTLHRKEIVYSKDLLSIRAENRVEVLISDHSHLLRPFRAGDQAFQPPSEWRHSRHWSRAVHGQMYHMSECFWQAPLEIAAKVCHDWDKLVEAMVRFKEPAIRQAEESTKEQLQSLGPRIRSWSTYSRHYKTLLSDVRHCANAYSDEHRAQHDASHRHLINFVCHAVWDKCKTFRDELVALELEGIPDLPAKEFGSHKWLRDPPKEAARLFRVQRPWKTPTHGSGSKTRQMPTPKKAEGSGRRSSRSHVVAGTWSPQGRRGSVPRLELTEHD